MRFFTLVYLLSVSSIIETTRKEYGSVSGVGSDVIDWEQVEPFHRLPEALEQDDIDNGEDTDTTLTSDSVSATKRIYGGKVAQPHSFPYQVGLLIRTTHSEHWCGGALISDRFIITAAHCVDRSVKTLVFLGAHEIRNPQESGQKRIQINRRNVLVHPHWNPRMLKNDIALVRLPKAITFTDNIQPISLPSYGHTVDGFVGQKAVASGWGKFSYHSKISFVLRYYRAPVIDMKLCRKAYPKILQPSNICVSGAYDRSTCSGDSGGPLVSWDYLADEKILIGITSFGSIMGCDKGFPSVFTRISSYLDWISDNTDVFIE